MGFGRPDQQVYLIVERVNQQTEEGMRLVIRIAVRKTAPSHSAAPGQRSSHRRMQRLAPEGRLTFLGSNKRIAKRSETLVTP